MTNEVPAEVLAAAMTAPDPSPAPAAPAKKPRARAKKATTAKKQQGPNPAAGLIAAMKFLAPAQSKTGNVNQTFCHIAHHWAAASNGVLTIATKIEEDLNACPQWALFSDALGKVVEDVTITQLSPGMLSVASGDFRGVVPCAPPEQVPITPPDQPCARIDNRIRDAFEAVLKIPNEQSPRAAYAGVLLQANSVVATNGAIIFEYWHGIDLPPNLIIPKAAAQAVAKSSKNLDALGFSSSSVTFYFEDGSFIKTQTYAEQYPEYAHVLNCDYSTFWPIPERFFEAVSTVAAFSENANVFFKNGQIVSSMNDETPSFYRIEGLPEGEGFNGKYIAMIEGKAARIGFGQSSNIGALFFVGNNIRGCIAALDRSAPKVYTSESSDDWANPGYAQEERGRYFDPDDEIPF